MKTKSIVLTAAIVGLSCLASAEAGTRSRTVTGPRGNTAIRTVDSSYVPGTGVTRAVTATGPQGNTASAVKVVTGTPYGREVTVTGGGGKVATADVYRGPAGHVRATRVTGPNGNTRRFVRVR